VTAEGKVKNAVKLILKDLGAFYFMPVSGGFGKHGICDIICCLKGRFIGIETKAGKGKTTALQDRCMDEIRAAGGVALVINEESVKTLREVLDGIK